MRTIKKINPRLSSGVVAIFYLDILALIQVFTGFNVFDDSNRILIILIGLLLVLYFGEKLCKGYDKENNDNELFYYILAVLGGIFIVLAI